MERMCENCKYSCVDNDIAGMFCMGQKNMPIVRPFDTCDDWKPAYRTNGDAIRQMSDEELAKWLNDNDSYFPTGDRTQYWLDWLKQEVEDD